MRATTKASLARIAKIASDFSEGIDVVYVSSEEENWIALKALRWTDMSKSAEGIQIFQAGVDDQEQQMFRFEKAALNTAGITRFDPSGYFSLVGERWDIVGGSPMAFNMGPSADNNATVYLLLRRNIEKKNTICGNTFGFDVEDED